jgi:tetratricopeptide (TPR) repeat protein
MICDMVAGQGPTVDEIRTVVDALDASDEDWAGLQWMLADALHDRFLDETGEPRDLDEAIERGTSVVREQGELSPEHLLDLALMLWTRIEHGATAADLQEYIRLNDRALSLVRNDRSREDLIAACQANLASGLMTRNRFEPSDADREEAVALWQEALESSSLDDDQRAGIHANLAQALSCGQATVAEVREAVGHGRQALEIGVGDDQERAQLHFSLANALTSLAEQSNTTGLVEEAINHIRQGLHLIGSHDPDYPGFSVNLVTALRARARETGDGAFLDEAQDIVRHVILPGIPAGHHDHVMALTMSAAIVAELAYWRACDPLHSEAIDLYNQAVAAAEPESHEQAVALVNLASASRDASERLDDVGLIDSGIQAGVRALQIFDSVGLHRASALTATSNLLRDRFVARGRLSDLDDALDMAEQALAQTPPQHQEHAARQTNLAVLLSDDYAERANRAQLDRAITLYRAALAISEPVARRVAERQNDLALALRDRYRDTTGTHDLDEAIAWASDSVHATPRGSVAWAGYANNYANALAERFELTGDIDDLQEAITLFAEVLSEARDRPSEASGYASNLGLALATRAYHSGQVGDLDEALEHLTRSVDLLPEDHPDLAFRIGNLSDLQRQRCQAARDSGDPAAAIELARTAAATAARAAVAAGSSDARLLPALANQARAIRLLHNLDPDGPPLDRVVQLQRQAALLSDISPAERFSQSALWARDAHQLGDRDQALAAYRQAVGLTSEVAWIGLTEAERLTLLQMMSEVLVSAVRLAIDMGEVWTALAWADQIRAVLARQNVVAKGSARSNLSGDSLAAALIPYAAPTGGPENGPGARERRRVAAHQQAGQLRLPPPNPAAYESLRFPGVVVLLVPGDDYSMALLVHGSSGDHRVVRLPRASSAALAKQVAQFREGCLMFGDMATSSAMERESRARHRVFDCLAWLWEAVADPILPELPTESASPRIWWSPVGDFALLPIHAAGVHPRKATAWRHNLDPIRNPSVADRVVSSYLPTIMPVRSGEHAQVPGQPVPEHRLLYVGTDINQGSLPQAAAELATIRQALTRMPIEELTDHEVTAESIRQGISRHRFLHVSAHGAAPDDVAPHTAGFRMAAGDTFSLAELAQCDAPGGRLAVFLTCDAAAGDSQTPNEALHLAGAAQQAGYSDVIAATMPLRDAPTVSVVGPLYRAVDHDPSDPCEHIAHTLHHVVNQLRQNLDTGPDPLAWAPYAHFGWGLGAGQMSQLRWLAGAAT